MVIGFWFEVVIPLYHWGGWGQYIMPLYIDPPSLKKEMSTTEQYCLWNLNVLWFEAKLSLDSIYKILFLNIFWRGGDNILYHNILTTPPTQTLFEISKLILRQQRPVNGRNDKAKLSLDSALKLSFLYIIEGGSIYYTIIYCPPPLPIPWKRNINHGSVLSVICNCFVCSS